MVSVKEERQALLRAIDALPPDALPALRQMVEIFSQALAHEREQAQAALGEDLQAEMAAWDAASDEALAGFERQLDAAQ